MSDEELKPWTVHSSKYLLESPWMNIRADVCETSDGVTLDPFYVMEAPDFVHVVPFDHAGRLLVTRQYRHGNTDIQWEIPCGMVDATDESPLAAAQRELLEETGCVGEKFVELPTIYANPMRQDNPLHSFIATGVTLVAEPDQDATEHILFEFMEVEAVLERIRQGQFQNALLVSSLMMALSKRFH